MTGENIIVSKIKQFQMEYPDGVPINILKQELDTSVEELQKNLLSLEEQGILFIENGEYVKLVESPSGEDVEETDDLPPLKEDDPALIIPDKPAVENAKTYDLTEREIQALDMIKDLTDESGHISRYIMEGTLMYGDLKLSTLGVYNLIMSLENKGIIRKVQIRDSEYYAV